MWKKKIIYKIKILFLDCNKMVNKPKVKIIPIFVDTREGGKIDLKCEAG